MIEIAIQEIQKYDMVKIFEKALAGEMVVLTHNDKVLNLTPNQHLSHQIIHDKNVHLADLFRELNVQLPPDYRFDRDEANSR